MYKGIETFNGGPPVIKCVGRFGSDVFNKLSTIHGVILTVKNKVALSYVSSLVFLIYTSYDPTLSIKPAFTLN